LATDPNTLLPSPPPEALALAARLRAALADKKMSVKDIEKIIVDTGREVTAQTRKEIKANVDYVRSLGGDPDLVAFNFLPIPPPEPGGFERSMFFPEGTPAPQFTDTIAPYDPTFQERAYQFVREQAAPFFGADPQQAREAAELLVSRRDAPRAGLMDLTPLAALTSIPEGASTFTRGVRFGEPGTAGLGALEVAGGVLEALPLAGPAVKGARQLRRAAPSGVPAAVPDDIGRQAVEAFDPSNVAPTVAPIQRIAQAPETPPVQPRPRAAAAPEAPDPIRDLPTAPVDELPSVTIPDPVRITPEQRAIDAAALDASPPEALRNILTPVKQKEILGYQGDYAAALAEMGIFRPKKMPLTEFIQSHMQADTVPDNVRVALMKKHGIRSADDQLRAAGISRESLRRAAQDLNQASQLERQLQRLFQENPELYGNFEGAKQAVRELSSPYRRLLGIESGGLTTQIMTPIRNLLGVSGIMPTYNAIVELMDVAIRAGRNVGRVPDQQIPGPTATDALYSFWDQFAGTYAALGRTAAEGVANTPSAAINQARIRMGLPPLAAKDIRIPQTRSGQYKDEFMEAFRASLPNQYNKLYGRYASDQPVPRGDTTTKLGKTLAGVERAVDFLNIGNRMVDRISKNAQFPSILAMEAKREGIDLFKLFDEGRLSELKDSGALEKAIRLMHKRAFEDRPEGPETYNRLARSAIDIMNYTTRPLGASPFPNYFVSFFKHVFEQSPFAIVRFASKAERKKIAQGDHRAITQIGAGLATTLAYYTLKDPDDGTKWHEFNVDGTPVDMSAAMAPHLPSMLQAHLLHLAEQGRLNEFDWGADLAKVIGSSNLRAGVGQYAVDEGFREAIRAAETGDASGAKRLGEQWVRERISGWPIFFRNFRDIFDREQAAINRDPQTVAQELATNFPGGPQFYERVTGEEIPMRYTPTKAEPTRGGDPLLRQLTGAFIREERNEIEKLITDLGMTNSDLYRRSGLSDTYDRLMVQEIGRLTEQKIDNTAPLVERVARNFDKLKNQPPEEVRLKVREEYAELRSIARDILAEQMPIYESARYYDSLSADEKIQQDKKDIANPKKGRTFREFFRDVEKSGVRLVAFSEDERDSIPSGTTYVDMPTYSIKVKP
jgi:hypothetical protein